jgi:transposase
VGKESHSADVPDNDGERLFARALSNDQGDLEALLDHAAGHGVPGLVIDQPGSIAQLVLAVAARRGTPVAYVPGLVKRRAADLYHGEAKTDRRDAYFLADTARTRRKQVHWLDTASDELLAQLRVLNGFDTDLAADQTRITNRLRDALTSISPALERALGNRLHQAGVQGRGFRREGPGRAGRDRARRDGGRPGDRRARDRAGPDFARRAALGKEIEEAFHSHPFGEILASLPGIGPRTGARILAEIGDSSGFASGAKLAAYAGLAPVTGQSGTSLNAEIRSRRGNHQLKNAMFLAAFASLRDPASTFPVVEGRRRAAKTARAPNQPGPVARQWMPTGRMRLTGRAGQCP